jgi:hypothetical protein
VSDAEALIGPVGAAALDEARRALEEAAGNGDGDGAALRVAGWTPVDWSFRFELAGSGRHVVVHVPHDGSPLAVRDGGPGTDPLTGGRGVP